MLLSYTNERNVGILITVFCFHGVAIGFTFFGAVNLFLRQHETDLLQLLHV